MATKVRPEYRRYPRDFANYLESERWLRYDEPGLRWHGNRAMFQNDIAIFEQGEFWDIVKAKDKFPLGQKELAGKTIPSNEYIAYILKVKTVFRYTFILKGNTKVKAIVLSNFRTKEETLKVIKARIENRR